MKIEWIHSTLFQGRITSSTIDSFKALLEVWTREVKKRNLNHPPGYVSPSITIASFTVLVKQEKKTELQHEVEKAYQVKLKAPISTNSLDNLWDDTAALLKTYWYVVVFFAFFCVLYFCLKYIKGVHDKLNNLEIQMRFLSEACLNRSKNL